MTTEHYLATTSRRSLGRQFLSHCHVLTRPISDPATRKKFRGRQIAREHQKDHLLTMLRTWGSHQPWRSTVPELARRRFENFRDRLEQDGQVVDYGAMRDSTLFPPSRESTTG